MTKKVRKAKAKTVGEKVLAYLARCPNGATSDQIARRIGGGHTTATVSSACGRLKKAGLLKTADGTGGRGGESVWVKK